MLVIFTTTPKIEEAERLAERIVAEKLAACVQILPQMKSVYFWDGSVQKDTEHLLLIKTLEEKYQQLEKFIAENHSYDVPEITAVSAEKVSDRYLSWINEYMAG